MSLSPHPVEQFRETGAAVFAGIVTRSACDTLLPEMDGLAAGKRIASPSLALRNLISETGAIGQLASTLGGSTVRPVRILAFDKSPKRNWALGWHQDRVIAVKERIEASGFTNWTVKSGVPHVEPPKDILQQMFSLRLHLDHCGPENGVLKIIPCSWLNGPVETTTLLEGVESAEPVLCVAECGDILAMRALTYHASDAAEKPTRRRVLHVDFATCDLPDGLQWFLPQEAGA